MWISDRSQNVTGFLNVWTSQHSDEALFNAEAHTVHMSQHFNEGADMAMMLIKSWNHRIVKHRIVELQNGLGQKIVKFQPTSMYRVATHQLRLPGAQPTQS